MGLALGPLAFTLELGVKPEPCNVQSFGDSAEHSAPPSSPTKCFKVMAFKAERLRDQKPQVQQRSYCISEQVTCWLLGSY
jgi:hypothetical protein